MSRLTRPKMRDFESAKIGIIKDVRGLLIETERLVQMVATQRGKCGVLPQPGGVRG